MREQDRIIELAGLIPEANLPASVFKQTERELKVWLTLDRDNYGGYYKIESDKWFRLFNSKSQADGYGLMFRDFRVTQAKGTREAFSQDYTQYKFVGKYLPSEFDDPDDDKSSNYEKASGFLFIADDLGITGKDVEAFVKSNMSKYKP